MQSFLKRLQAYSKPKTRKLAENIRQTETPSGKRGHVNGISRHKTEEKPTLKEHARIPIIPLTTLLLATLLLSSTTLPPQPTTAQTTASIGTEGAVWPDPRISVVITPATGATWYKQSYANDAAHAIQRWTQSIIVFTDNHGFKYLRALTFDIYTADINQSIPSSPDVRISFVQSFPQTGPPALGVTQSRTTPNNLFDPPVTMRLATYDPLGLRQLTNTDMVNIATHEFGHALGLGHAAQSTTDDNFLELMSTEYNLPVGSLTNLLQAPSTLDLYALSQIYSWLQTSTTLTSPGPPATTITLPSSISYTAVYPYTEQITALKTTIDQANLKILTLVITTVALFAIAAALAIFYLKRKLTPPPVQPPAEQPPSIV